MQNAKQTFDDMKLYRAKERIALPKSEVNHITKGGLVMGIGLNGFIAEGNELDIEQFEEL